MDTIKKFEEKYRGFLESLPDAIVIVNGGGVVQIVNSQTEKIFGYSREEIVGQAVEKLMPPNNRAAHYSLRKSFWDNPVARPMGAPGMDLFAQRRDGTQFPVAISLNKLQIEEGIYSLAAIRDVSYQKKIEQELKEARVAADLAAEIADEAKRKAESAVVAKQQFLSNMSHEIRTPMTAIVGFSKVVLKTDLTDEQREYISAIKTSSDSLLVIINDILDLAKVDAGKMIFEQVPFKMEAEISTMLTVFETNFKEKNLKLIRNYDSAIPKVLLGDAVRLRQIILNLVSNAIEFTSKGNVVVGVSLLSEDEESVIVEFSVTDTGIGIPQDSLSSIFENFQQAASSTSRLYGGTGLGLAIVKQLVEQQGGTISVQSNVDEGSTFSFVLSFQKTNEVSHVDTEITTLDPEVEKIKVLVVEDVALNQLLMKILLDDFGFERDIADNGRDALEKLQSNSYDIILMDLQMPEMNGFETTDHIRNKMNSKIPIIALTADVTAEDLSQCKTVGMNDHIAKPIDEKLLYRKIIELVKKPIAVE